MAGQHNAKGTGRIGHGTPARDVAAAGHGKITGGARAAGTANARAIQALVALATKRKTGLIGALPHPSANAGPTLPATGAADNDADDMPPTMPGAPSAGAPIPMLRGR